jgi:TRAP-type C4-dicarboxylate transport system permease small subunit
MTVKACRLQLIAICAIFILLCVLGIIWAITSGLLVSGIDGIMLLFVCLMMAGIFALMILLLLQQAGVLPAFGHSKSKAAAAPAAKPAAQASQPAPQGK